MVKSLLPMIALLTLLSRLWGNVVINEVLYDPLGTDSGFEWIELYNNGNTDINLQNAKLQVAGTAFNTVFNFPHYILRAKRFVLIGEETVTQAVFTSTLNMPNAISGTDGLRYVSADGIYTDTVLFGTPNTNYLRDDLGGIGTRFAPDVQAGYSLARIVDGHDTNYCDVDFVSEASPTPGYPNRIFNDYALENTSASLTSDYYTFVTDIYNNSPANCDTLNIVLNILLNDSVIHTFDIQPIPHGGNVNLSTPISVYPESVGLLKAELILYNDINPNNNTWTLNLGSHPITSLHINEFMYNPASGNQEWIELHVPPSLTNELNLLISDAANHTIQFALPASCPEYIVLCKDKSLLQNRYPDCPVDNILQVSTIPALNNEGDSVILKELNGAVIDSMQYIGNANKRDISLERYVTQDSMVFWRYSYAELKATPGKPNSDAPAPSELDQGKVKVIGSPFNPLLGQNMRLQFNFSDVSNAISCFVYDIYGKKVHTIASGLSVGNCGELVWNGKDKSGKALPRGIYILLVEAKNSSKKYFMRKQLTVVLATK